MILLLVYRDRHVILLEFEKEMCALNLAVLKTFKCKKETCALNLFVLKIFKCSCILGGCKQKRVYSKDLIIKNLC